ncbi:MAG TPA: hypothetical protein VJS37_14460, partial [Terriglobales bacterium]|nr:hypothetical protein [Terriglobales bacterium]
MRSRQLTFQFPLVAAVLLAFATSAWSAPTLTFVPATIQFPGSSSTAARGINNNGDIVGSYTCAKSLANPCTGITPGSHGFLLLAGTTNYLRIDVPEAGVTGSLPRAI